MTTLEQIEEHLTEADRLLSEELGDVGDDALEYVRKAQRALARIPPAFDIEKEIRGANAAVIALRGKGLL